MGESRLSLHCSKSTTHLIWPHAPKRYTPLPLQLLCWPQQSGIAQHHVAREGRIALHKSLFVIFRAMWRASFSAN